MIEERHYECQVNEGEKDASFTPLKKQFHSLLRQIVLGQNHEAVYTASIPTNAHMRQPAVAVSSNTAG